MDKKPEIKARKIFSGEHPSGEKTRKPPKQKESPEYKNDGILLRNNQLNNTTF